MPVRWCSSAGCAIRRRAAGVWPLHDDLTRFLQPSRRDVLRRRRERAGDAVWLVELSRRCRDASGRQDDALRRRRGCCCCCRSRCCRCGATPRAPLPNGWLAYAPRDRASAARHVLRLLCGPRWSPRWWSRWPRRISPNTASSASAAAPRSCSCSIAAAAWTRASQPAHGPQRPRGTGPEALEYYFSQARRRLRESKGKVARQLLGDFTAQRPARPLRAGRVQHPADARARLHRRSRDVIQAAIAAGNIGRGLSETDIGLRARRGARNVRRPAVHRIAHRAAGVRRWRPDRPRHARATGARAGTQAAGLDLLALPAFGQQPGLRLSDQRFDRRGRRACPSSCCIVSSSRCRRRTTPTRPATAKALKQAIADVNRLENLPITTHDVVPRRDLTPWFSAAALCGVLLLLAASWLEIRRWS